MPLQLYRPAVEKQQQPTNTAEKLALRRQNPNQKNRNLHPRQNRKNKTTERNNFRDPKTIHNMSYNLKDQLKLK
jgi:hypothetical protein